MDGTYKAVYPTKRLKYTLSALGEHEEANMFGVPDTAVEGYMYSNLLWEALERAGLSPTEAARQFDWGAAYSYPSLIWAEDHFFGTASAKLNSGVSAHVDF